MRGRWPLALLGCGVVGGLFLLLLLVAGTISVLVLSGRFGDVGGFDAARWREARQGCAPDNPRGGMYSGMREELLREPMRGRPTRAEVLGLLGPPDAGRGPRMLGYQLGLDLGVDCTWTEIRFGPGGRVSDVRYVQG
jgi:hypothetical protein